MSAYVCWVVLVYLLYSSASSTMLSVSQHGPRVLIAKSYGAPIKLTCADHQTIKINIKGISLFKWKKTVPANHVFPGIYTQSQSECQNTFHQADNTLPVECELNFSGRKIPPDFMIVTVYECVTAFDMQKQLVHTRITETGDMLLTCDFGKLIDIEDIKLNETEANVKEKEAAKQQCTMKMMMQVSLAPSNLNSGPRNPVSCTVSRKGKNGKLMVKYKCLQAPQMVSSQQKPYIARKKGLVGFKKSRLQSNYSHRLPRKRTGIKLNGRNRHLA